MDLRALYLNCKSDATADAIKDAFKLTGQSFININCEVLLKIASLFTNGQYEPNHELNQFFQVPKQTTTLRSYLKRRSDTQFRGPTFKPASELTDKQVNTLLGFVSSKYVVKVMENHYFTIGGKIFRQTDGSPIGVDLSVETASLVMLFWDSKFLKKLKKLGLRVGLYKRYVDDVFMILNNINPGWYFCVNSKKIKFDPTHASSKLETDARHFEILCKIANSLDENIQMEADFCSNHENGRLPVLDLDIFVASGKVEFSFFRKKMTSKYCILYRSAISQKTKRDSLFQDGIRILRNMSPGIGLVESEMCYPAT